MQNTSTSTTTLYPWRKVEEEQAARYGTIFRHFGENVRLAIQGKDQEASLAAIAGFSLVADLYDDLCNPVDRYLSDTAGDRLIDLVRFCFGYAFNVGDTTWPVHLNSLSGLLENPQNVPGVRENWMARRAVLLVTDLKTMGGLFTHPSPHLRDFMVGALDFVAEFSFESGARARRDNSTSHVELWRSLEEVALGLISKQVKNADPFIRNDAEDAGSDLKIREAWYKVAR